LTLDAHRSEIRQEADRGPANALALKAGYHYGETAELFHEQYEVPKAKLPARHVSQDHRQRSDCAGD
jgi:hypothetical protein